MLLALCGCATAPPAQAEEVPEQGPNGGQCDAAKAQALVGRTASETVGSEALRLSGARTLRRIPEGGMVTMDYREDRLNLHLDRQNRIVRIACG